MSLIIKPTSGLATILHDGLEVARITKGGGITGNVPAFRCYRTTVGKSLAVNTLTELEYNLTSYDYGGNVVQASTVTRFVAPVAGVYQFNAAASLQALESTYNQLVLNVIHADASNESFASSEVSGAANLYWKCVAGQIVLAAGDIVRVLLSVSGTANTHTGTSGAAGNYFAGHLVRQI